MKFLSIVITLMVVTAFTVFSSSNNSVSTDDVPDILIQVPVSSEEEAKTLLDLGVQIELNMVFDNVAEGFISANNLKRVQDAGFSVTIVEPEQGGTGRKPWYDFDDVVDILTKHTKDYPDMVKFDTAGYSIKGKPVLQFKVFSTPDTAARQRIYFSGCCHGNEKIGTETIMLIIFYLLENYDSDQSVKKLLDRSEFVFHPIFNVDGFTSSAQGRRTLDNGKDPNRAFGWKLGGKSSDGSLPYQWPEIKTYLYPMIEAPSYFSLDYHAGMTGTLDPFFAPVSGGVMDGDAYSQIGKLYPPYSGMTRWEEIYILETRGGGIGCDASYGKCGNISILPECCNHYPPESSIEKISGYHMEKFLDCIEGMQEGVCGRIKDAQTGAPVYARVQIEGKGAATCSDPRSGAYYKYIPSPSGTFEVTVFANGYKTETKSVSANSNAFAALDFELTRDTEKKFAAISVDVVGLDNQISQKEIYACLQLHDDEATEVDGFIIVDFGGLTPVTDQDGTEDITVHATGTGSYTVSMHYDIDKIIDNDGIKVGDGSGTQSFDLSSISIDSARWVRIDASGTAEIDAIEAAPRDFPTAINSHPVSCVQKGVFKVVSPLSAGGDVLMHAYIPKGEYSVKVFDCKGKQITTLAHGNADNTGNQVFRWHSTRNVSNGTYIFHVTTTDGEKCVTSPVLW